MNTKGSAMKEQITRAFAQLNAHMLERQTEWALKRRVALKEKIAELTGQRRKMGETAYYEAIFAAAGGKTWFDIFHGRNEEMVREIVEKNIAKLIETRDARIIKALEKKGITEIPEFELTHMSDGYEGVFYVAGHRVTITTILAGGYNIQCLHQRTLIKVK